MIKPDIIKLYTKTWRNVVGPNGPGRSDIINFASLLPSLRKALICCICQKLPTCDFLAPPECHHFVCKDCMGKERKGDNECPSCQDWNLFKEDETLRSMLAGYRNFCLYFIQTGDCTTHLENSGTGLSFDPLLVLDLLEEGATLDFDSKARKNPLRTKKDQCASKPELVKPSVQNDVSDNEDDWMSIDSCDSDFDTESEPQIENKVVATIKTRVTNGEVVAPSSNSKAKIEPSQKISSPSHEIPSLDNLQNLTVKTTIVSPEKPESQSECKASLGNTQKQNEGILTPQSSPKQNKTVHTLVSVQKTPKKSDKIVNSVEKQNEFEPTTTTSSRTKTNSPVPISKPSDPPKPKPISPLKPPKPSSTREDSPPLLKIRTHSSMSNVYLSTNTVSGITSSPTLQQLFLMPDSTLTTSPRSKFSNMQQLRKEIDTLSAAGTTATIRSYPSGSSSLPSTPRKGSISDFTSGASPDKGGNLKTPPKISCNSSLAGLISPTATGAIRGVVTIASPHGDGPQKKLKVRLPQPQKTPTSSPKLFKGCRCGHTSVNPGKFTCCGQRCVCYVDNKECKDCKCKGCRNPFLSNGTMRQVSSSAQSTNPEVVVGNTTSPRVGVSATQTSPAYNTSSQPQQIVQQTSSSSNTTTVVNPEVSVLNPTTIQNMIPASFSCNNLAPQQTYLLPTSNLNTQQIVLPTAPTLSNTIMVPNHNGNFGIINHSSGAQTGVILNEQANPTLTSYFPSMTDPGGQINMGQAFTSVFPVASFGGLTFPVISMSTNPNMGSVTTVPNFVTGDQVQYPNVSSTVAAVPVVSVANSEGNEGFNNNSQPN